MVPNDSQMVRTDTKSVVILVDSDRQSKFLLESVSESISQSVRLPDLELLLCETESELKIYILKLKKKAGIIT